MWQGIITVEAEVFFFFIFFFEGKLETEGAASKPL